MTSLLRPGAKESSVVMVPTEVERSHNCIKNFTETENSFNRELYKKEILIEYRFLFVKLRCYICDLCCLVNQYRDKKMNQQQSSVSVFWDNQNVNLKFKSLGIFSRELQYFASTQGKLICQNVYYNSQHQNQVNNKII
ncbi:MAG: hypothetical protein C4323_22530 [Mastigocladus sp. ERB_26_2]